MSRERSLGEGLEDGGPCQAFLGRCGLSRGGEDDLRRQALAFIAVGWLPLVLFAGLDALWLGRYPGFATDLSVHARVLVAVPLLLAHERAVNRASGLAVRRFVTGAIVVDVERFAGIVRGANRVRGARLPELALLVVAVVSSQFLVWGGATGVGDVPAPGGERLTATAVWYSVVSLPSFQFLLGRAVWRWCIWSWGLWRISRLRLSLIPTDPDLAGGIAFVDNASAAFGLAAMAASTVLAATWGDRILAVQDLRVAAFVTPFLSFVLLVEAVALAPLLFFFGHCFRARWRGLREYGELARRYTRAFHERWVEPEATTAQPPGKLLGTADIQSLADLANSLSIIERMRPIPVGPRVIGLLAVCTTIPMIPLIATEGSVVELVSLLGRSLLGGSAEALKP